LNFFRMHSRWYMYVTVLNQLDVNSLLPRRNRRYQILYFTLEEPLNEAERIKRKVVNSIRIC
jgi:hypothetical protein